MGLLGAIAGAVAGPLVSGLFGSKDRKQETTTRTEVDLVQLKRSARQAGFNPLTALKYQGAGGSTTTGTSGALSSTEWLSDAIGAGASAWANYDPMASERARLENDLIRSEIERNRNPFSGVSVRTTAATSPRTYSAPALSDPVGGIETINRYINVYDPDTKQTVRVYNPDLTMDTETIAGQATFGAAAEWQQGNNYDPTTGELTNPPKLSFPEPNKGKPILHDTYEWAF